MEIIGAYSRQQHLLKTLSRVLVLPRNRSIEQPIRPTQRQHNFSAADERRIVDAYRRLRSIYAVAHEFDTTRQTVAAVLERHGIKRRFKLLAADDIIAAGQRYEQGTSLAALAAAYGVDANPVSAALRAAGVTMRPVGTNQWRRGTAGHGKSPVALIGQAAQN